MIARAWRPVDNTWLVLFRIAFGLILCVESLRYLLSGRATLAFVETSFHFKYLGFGWVEAWPGIGMQVHFVVLAVLAMAMAAGAFYRVAAAGFFLGFTYVFLLDQARYLNHYYLVCLLAFLMIFLPAHRALSLDARRRPALRSHTVAVGVLWLLRAQLGIVYGYAGLAKLNADWLRGEPLGLWVSGGSATPALDAFLTQAWVPYFVAYGGLALDMLVVPCLLMERTRFYALLVAVCFHLGNFLLFNIGIFPWLMLAATLLIFFPDQVARLAGRSWTTATAANTTLALAARQRLARAAVIAYLLLQFLIPLRHYAYPGDAAWTEEGHRFSWRMMLRSKDSWIRYMVTDPDLGTTDVVDPADELTERQTHKLGAVPDMILQYAHHLAAEYRARGHAGVQVRARVRTSLNGRVMQLLVDPDVDLAAEPRSLWPAKWILPLDEPLRRPERRRQVVPLTPVAPMDQEW